ncbi:MAG TPA: hypothetical protein VNR11_04735 [Xanthobacteraceae bacterium]|nr:hypothetical protein [Xanthobacteraceae bacterium]
MTTAGNKGAVQVSQEPKRCFVIGPIGELGSDIRRHSDFLFEGIVKEVTEKDGLDYRTWRADKDPHPGMITDKIINDIIESDIVIADLTFLNANVFYEIGIRHSVEKPIIHMVHEDTKLPFDNLGHRAIKFNHAEWKSIIEARQELKAQIIEIEKPTFKVTNPVTHALTTKVFRASADPIEQKISELVQRVTELEAKDERPKARKATIADAIAALSLETVEAQQVRANSIRTILKKIFQPSELKTLGPEVESFITEYASNDQNFSRLTDMIVAGDTDKVKTLVRLQIPF